MRILLDTCVISELQRPSPHPAVYHRVEGLDDETIFLSVLTLGELSKGVALLEPGTRKDALTSWIADIERRFRERILPIDVDVAHLWGEMTARARSNGIQIPAVDGLIAATALRHGLMVMTRNTRDFAATGAVILDPWD